MIVWCYLMFIFSIIIIYNTHSVNVLFSRYSISIDCLAMHGSIKIWNCNDIDILVSLLGLKLFFYFPAFIKFVREDGGSYYNIFVHVLHSFSFQIFQYFNLDILLYTGCHVWQNISHSNSQVASPLTLHELKR